ncbi:protein-export membrane protein SecD [Isosphaera pallida ATCC 43644]|uniref:Protein translocase subunit SecD n=1 Tax=Isosphaera pallida (strain ATCC 43644 / DSM 9630 / IS1B) TaxID=575540 RepID=E8R0B2_ISOPI|nr:protein-export membrane protein SecD [Isosphaera pallida ATCC 43644]
MKHHGSRLTVIALSALLAAWLIYPPEERLKLGIDLSGGTILVYQATVDSGSLDPAADDPNATPSGSAAPGSLDDLIVSLKQRLNPDGLKDITIRSAGENRLEILLPRATPEEVEDIKRRMTDVGSLEFRILANRRDDRSQIEALEADRNEAVLPRLRSNYLFVKLGEQLTGSGEGVSHTSTTLTDLSKNLVRNAYAGKAKLRITGTRPGSTRAETQEFAILRNSSNTFTVKGTIPFEKVTSYELRYIPSEMSTTPDPSDPQSPYVRRVQRGPGHEEFFILAKRDRYNVTGEYLRSVRQEIDDQLKNAVGFSFNTAGARRFGELTRQYQPKEDGRFRYMLAIVLDNVVMSAPFLNAVIKDRGIISGGQNGFSNAEIKYLIDILRSGSLPATLDPNPLFEETIGPTLGEDTINKGVRAIFVSMLLVPIFMIFYYGRYAGVIAVFALALNMLLLLAAMSLGQATFTLPGLAGLALTIGMAVDANILIFERIREEKNRGAGLAQQVRSGFDRAWSTILDANLTTIFAGLILLYLGTEEIKGFAITLILGLIWNMLTAVVYSRWIFEYLLHKRWIKEFRFASVLTKPSIDFLGLWYWFQAVSLTLIVVGLVAVTSLGGRLLNIDFTGGTLVTIRLKDQSSSLENLTATEVDRVREFLKLNDSQRIAWVREQSRNLPDVTVETLNVERPSNQTKAKADPATGQTPTTPSTETTTPGTGGGYRFNIRTTDTNPQEVQARIIEAFGAVLERPAMRFGQVEAIPPADSSNPSSSPSSRFAGGFAFPLNVSVPLAPSRVADLFARILGSNDPGPAIENPESRFEIVRATIEADAGPDTPTTSLVLRTDLPPDTIRPKLERLVTDVPNTPSLLFERLTNFGGVVAGETQLLAIYAVLASWIAIAAYLWLRFKSLAWGIAAIVALVHDVLITLGFIAMAHYLSVVPVVSQILMIEPFKIDLPMVAAFLTLIGYSVNDKIVIFDRIREIRGKSPFLTTQNINDAINVTLSRTILTSLTTWFVVTLLYFFGGEGIHGFAYCLVIGIVTGTYSSVAISATVLAALLAKPSPGGKAKVESSLVKPTASNA